MESNNKIEDTEETTYMASQVTDQSTRDLLAQAVRPDLYRLGDDVEIFIERCLKYFKVTGLPKTFWQILVEGLISPSLREQYDNVDRTVQGFDERLRKAFSRPISRMRDIQEMMAYERTNEDVKMFVKKVDAIVDRVLAHQWTKEELRKELLLKCNKDKETQKTVIMQDIRESEGIIKVLELMDKVKGDTEQVNAVKSYSNAVRQTSERRKETEEWRQKESGRYAQNANGYERNTKCYNCNRLGHISRFCDVPRKRKCFTCGAEDHIARNCKRNNCTTCGRVGHQAERCFQNQRRTDQANYRTTRPERTQGHEDSVNRYNQYEGKQNVYRNNQQRNGYGYDNYQNNGYGVRNDRNRNLRHVNTIETDGEEQYYYAGGDNREEYGRGRQSERKEDNVDPNGEAPSKDELIGAVY